MIRGQMVVGKRNSSLAQGVLLAPAHFGKHHLLTKGETGKGMSEASPSSDRLKIFVSYSRRELAIADKLVATLQVAGFTVTIDRRDLPFGEEWQKELAGLIRAADTVLWLVSQASVKSRWCSWELGEVLRLNKRLIPVVIDVVPPDALPEVLGRISVLPSEGVFDAKKHLPALVDARYRCRLAKRAHPVRRSRTPVDWPGSRSGATSYWGGAEGCTGLGGPQAKRSAAPLP